MAGPLEGFRIVDVSAMLSGPWATDILGDQGADVIKVEPPGDGDHTRSLRNRSGGMASNFLNINRSKRSLTLDLKSEGGKAVLKTVLNAVETDIAVFFSLAGQSQWISFPSKDYVIQAQNAGAGFDGFRLTVTGLDPDSQGADVYATFIYDEE